MSQKYLMLLADIQERLSAPLGKAVCIPALVVYNALQSAGQSAGRKLFPPPAEWGLGVLVHLGAESACSCQPTLVCSLHWIHTWRQEWELQSSP